MTKRRKRSRMTGHCAHVSVCFINRITVMRYWWGRDVANKGRGEKEKRERAADKIGKWTDQK